MAVRQLERDVELWKEKCRALNQTIENLQIEIDQCKADVELSSSYIVALDKDKTQAEIQLSNIRTINDVLVNQVETFKVDAILGQKVMLALIGFRRKHKQWFEDYPKVIQKDKFHTAVYDMIEALVGGSNCL
jgi:hypothetical protein